jgi:transcriptional regulator with XRE-family HTH domain
VNEPFGTVLRRLRERAGLTQEQLAEAALLSANAISALERGERRHPYPHTVRALAVALELSAGQRAALEAAVPRRGGRQRPMATVPTRDQEIRRTVDSSGLTSARLPVPRQLPAVTRDFTGRAADLTRLDALLPAAETREGSKAGDSPSGAVVRAAAIAAIDGAAGVGKTTLALVWAHRVSDLFPDGQLYVNLRGYDPGSRAKPEAVLDGFLRALNIRADMIPPTVQERAALFRSLVNGRRMLVVLDNASSAEQVRPLLPGSPTCLVVVTSRTSLSGLAVSVGPVRINLDVLSSEEAVALLRTIIGEHRAEAEAVAVAELARLCARLPLALQVAGQRAAARPHVPLVDLNAELADEAQRLEVLSAGTDEFTSVRAVFSWSHRNLPDGQARMFRLLGLHPGPNISSHAAACLVQATPTQARWLLGGLAEAHLVEHAGPDRFRSHDLLRAYAREQCARGHNAENQHDAVRRMVGFYLHTAAAADHLLHPGRRRVLVDGAPPPDHPVVSMTTTRRWHGAKPNGPTSWRSPGPRPRPECSPPPGKCPTTCGASSICANTGPTRPPSAVSAWTPPTSPATCTARVGCSTDSATATGACTATTRPSTPSGGPVTSSATPAIGGAKAAPWSTSAPPISAYADTTKHSATPAKP